MGFHGVSTKNLVYHLVERYGKIWASHLEVCRKALAEPLEVDPPIDVHLQRVEDTIQLSQDRKAPFTPVKIVRMEYNAVNKTGLYYLTLKEWKKKATSEKTWASFKQVFTEEYHKMVEETKFTNMDTDFTLQKNARYQGGD